MARLLYGSWAEQRRSEAHDGGSLEDRRLEVPAHAHGERVEAQARGIELLAERAQPCEPAALPDGLALLRGQAHEPAQREAGERGDRARELRKLVRRDAALARLAREVHLQAHVEGRCA